MEWVRLGARALTDAIMQLLPTMYEFLYLLMVSIGGRP